MSDKFMTPEFRVNYANVLKPQKKDNASDKDKFSICMVFSKKLLKTDPKAKADYMAIKQACEKLAEATGSDQLPFKDGDEKEWKGEGDNPFEGCIYADASTQFTPELFDRNRNDIMTEEEFYNGCYARARVHCYDWTYKSKSGISLGFDAVQKLRDGEKIRSGGSAKDSFDALDPLDDDEVTEGGEDDLLV